MQYNELYHHGRLGQRWGQKNGPPYPLSRGTVSQAYGKKKRGVSGYLQRRKEKKLAKKEEENEKQRRAAEEAKAKYDAEKERVLRSGNASEVLKYKDDLTPIELNNALNRIRWTNELSKLASDEVQDGWKKVDKIMKKMGNIKDWTKTSVDLWKNLDELVGMMEKHSK